MSIIFYFPFVIYAQRKHFEIFTANIPDLIALNPSAAFCDAGHAHSGVSCGVASQ
jgi:hypothetical protein